MIDPTDAFQQLLVVLDRLEIRYAVGGSIASGIHGVPRQTNDIDFIADFRNVDMTEFCRSLGVTFTRTRTSPPMRSAGAARSTSFI